MTQPGPTRHYGGRSAADRRAERRARLLQAGLQLFGTVGYAMAPVGSICKLANLSTRQYYEEFTSREALLVALSDEINGRAMEAVVLTLRELGDATFATRMATALNRYVENTASDLRCARVLYVEIVGVNLGIEEHRLNWRHRWVGLIHELLDAAIAAGEIPRRDYALASGAFIGAVNGLLQDWCASENRAPLPDVVAELSRLGLAATAW